MAAIYGMIDFYLLYYDNLYNFVFHNYGFCIQEMQWDTYYIKFMIGKQDGTKVEG